MCYTSASKLDPTMDLTKPNHHWLYNKLYVPQHMKRSIPRDDGTYYTFTDNGYSTIDVGLNSEVDGHHMWTIFTMYWPAIFAAALYGRE